MVYLSVTNVVVLYQCDYKKNICENIVESDLLNNIKFEIDKYIVTNTITAQAPPLEIDTSKINSLYKKLEKLKDLYLDDLIDKDSYKRDFQKYSSELEKLEKEKANTEKTTTKDFSKLKQILNSDFESMYRTLSQAEKRKFWVSIIDNIYYEDGKIARIEFS